MTRRTGGTTAVLGTVAALALGTVLVRQDVPAYEPPAAVPATAEDCTPFDADLLPERSFALAGTVTRLSGLPGSEGEMRARLAVEEWLRGPALAHLDVSIPRETVADLWQGGGSGLAVGDRLLVAGDSWTSSRWPHLAEALSCGWTRRADADSLAEWSARLSRGPVPEADPTARYARYTGVGFTTGRADLRGVLIHDAGCLYVQDGRRRWLPVFPDHTSTRWQESLSVLQRGSVSVAVGNIAALGGGPAVAAADESSGFAVPAGCDPAVERWVVAEPHGLFRVRRTAVPPGAPFVRDVLAVLAGLGHEATVVSGYTIDDSYGRTTMTAVFDAGGRRLEVRVESPLPSAGLEAYGPRPEDLSLVTRDEVEVGVVQPADGSYAEAVVRLWTGLVATVTDRAAPGEPAPDPRLLAEVAAGMARPR